MPGWHLWGWNVGKRFQASVPRHVSGLLRRIIRNGVKPGGKSWPRKHGSELLYLLNVKQHSLSSEEKNERDMWTT